jgi:hypothetical protein
MSALEPQRLGRGGRVVQQLSELVGEYRRITAVGGKSCRSTSDASPYGNSGARHPADNRRDVNETPSRCSMTGSQACIEDQQPTASVVVLLSHRLDEGAGR